MNENEKNITLLIDADDTLWDNNIYYEGAIHKFTDLMQHYGLPKEVIQQRLRRREIENVEFFGYGSKSFTSSMKQVYEEICRELKINQESRILNFIDEARHITRNYPINLLPGVEETLPRLVEKFRLFLLTKGETDEQKDKIKRSTIGGYFEEIIVVPEKDEEMYRKILRDFRLHPAKTYMIGNSPRSDINPARQIGLKTVLIPYHTTWEHEIEEIIDEGHETAVIENFALLIELLR